MLTLDQAIELASKAHKDQWRRPIILQSLPIGLTKIKKINGGYILSNGAKLTHTELGGYYNYAEPYITHPLAIMDMMSTDEEKIVAVLHDVIEDTDCKLQIKYETAKIHSNTLGKFSVPLNIAYALEAITKKPNEEYKKFILRVADNKLATKVKIADIIHNLSEVPSKHAKQKYLKAIPILLKEI